MLYTNPPLILQQNFTECSTLKKNTTNFIKNIFITVLKKIRKPLIIKCNVLILGLATIYLVSKSVSYSKWYNNVLL